MLDVKITNVLKVRLIRITDWVRIKLFSQRNKILAALTLVLIPSILIIIRYCDLPLILPERYFSFLLCNSDGDKTVYNIAISYLAAYIFYLIQVFFPSRHKENSAYRLIRKQLSELIRDTKEIIYIFNEMYDVNDYGELTLKQDEILFYKESWDSYKLDQDKVKPNPDRVKNGKYKHAGFYSCRNEADFCKKAESIKNKYEKLIDSRYLQNCDESLIDMLEGFMLKMMCSKMIGAIEMRRNAYIVNKIVHEKLIIPQVADKLNQSFRDISGLSAIPQKDGVEISYQGEIIQKFDLEEQENINRISGVAFDIQAVKNQMSRIEYFCDVDGEVSFRKRTDEEVQQDKYYEGFSEEIIRQWKR